MVGFGFIVFVVVIFGCWDLIRVIFVVLLFGFVMNL